MERENLFSDVKGQATSGSNREGESTEAERRGGAARSSDAMPDAALHHTCRLADYAEWFREDTVFPRICRWSSDRRPASIRHSLTSYSASRNASRRSLGLKRTRLRRS